MKTRRKVITIDQEKCNGCGQCITTCVEGALKLINGKARLVKEQFCDGLGDCIGECPTGALQIKELEVEDFNYEATVQHVSSTGGLEALAKLEAAKQRHEKTRLQIQPQLSPLPHRCPGSLQQSLRSEAINDKPSSTDSTSGPAQAIRSELSNWPVQIHLVQPGAAFFQNRELVVMSTCGPLASPDVHWRFIRGRSLVVACPKLDRTDGYVEKLAAILREASIPKVIVVRMEVPCCGGLTLIVKEAVTLCGRSDLVFEEVTLGIKGDLLKTEKIC